MPLIGHFTSNMSWNVHGGTYFASCENLPKGTFSSWESGSVLMPNLFIYALLSWVWIELAEWMIQWFTHEDSSWTRNCIILLLFVPYKYTKTVSDHTAI